LIYRVHEEPSKEKLLAFSDYLRTISIPFAKGQVMKPAVFNRILERARGTPHQEVINDVVLRTQAQAVYDTNNVGHFGLNLARYAHFTSPIRRYADLIVHRALIRARHLGDDGLSDAQTARLKGVADHISMTERRAMAAERDSRRPICRGLYAGSRRRGVQRTRHRRDEVWAVPAVGRYGCGRIAADALARVRFLQTR
jgi:ribonuclease R